MFSSVYFVSARSTIDFFNLPEDEYIIQNSEEITLFASSDVLQQYSFSEIKCYSSGNYSYVMSVPWAPTYSIPPSIKRTSFNVTVPSGKAPNIGTDAGASVHVVITSPIRVSWMYFGFTFYSSDGSYQSYYYKQMVNASGVIDFIFPLSAPLGYERLSDFFVQTEYESVVPTSGVQMSLNKFELVGAATNQDIIDAEREEGEKTRDEIKNQTEEQKGMFAKLFENISNFFKNLFFPPDGYFDALLSDLNSYFGDRFGFLYYPFEVIIDFVNRMLSVSSNNNDLVIDIPDISYEGVTLLHSRRFSLFDSLPGPVDWHALHDRYLMMVDVVLGFWFINLSYKKVKEVFAN